MASSAPATPDADAEAAVLDRVEGALAGADEVTLTKLTSALLVPSLAKLASPHASTRTRVPTVLQHFLARIKPAESITLPLADLVALWSSQAAGAPMILLFIDLAWRRAPQAQRVQNLPLLMNGFSSRAASLQAQLFQLFLLALPLPEDGWVPELGPERQMWLTYVEQFMLLPAGTINTAPPALSLAQAKLVLGKRSSWGTEELAQTKAALLHMLTSPKFDATEVHCLFLIGAADPHHVVVNTAEDGLRRSRMGQQVQMESLALIDHMITLYLGNATDISLLEDQRIPPASIPLKLRLLGELAKSIAAAGRFPRVLQVLFDAVFGAASNARLRLAGMAFLQWLARHAPLPVLRSMAPLLLAQLLKFLDGTNDIAQRTAAYDALGLLAKRAPAPFAVDASLLPRFFAALSDETVRSSVRDTLTLAASAFADPPAERSAEIDSLLISAVESSEATARFAAVFCSLRIYPFAHCVARLVCLLASADSRADVRDEAARGLRPYVRKDGEPMSGGDDWPPFVAMVQCVHTAVLSRPAPADSSLVAPAPVYEAALAFLSECLTHEAAKRFPSEPLLANAMFVASLLANPQSAAAISSFEAIAISLLQPALQGTSHAAGLKALTLVASSLEQPAQRLKLLLPSATILRLFSAARPDVREDAARLAGVMSVAEPVLLDTLISGAQQPAVALEQLHGIAIALGASLGVRRAVSLDSAQAATAIALLIKLTRNPNSAIAAAACTSLGHGGRRNALPLPRGEPQGVAEPPSQWGVLRLLSELLSGNDRRVAERAGGALGVLCGIGLRDFDMQDAAQAALLSQAPEKQEDVQLTIGEGLAVLAAGLNAPCARDALLDGPVLPPPPATDKRAESVVRAIMALTSSPLTPVRCSAAVWMLCILQHAGASAAVAALTGEACASLAALLGDVNELTSEAAARALVVAYERASDEAQRNALLAQLMRSLTGSGATPTAPKRAAESEVFEEGVLGQTPDGSGMSTYRELSSLAAETGQPDLLYRMLGLAQHHAIWTSRRAAAFAATALASRTDAAAAMQAHLPVLLPRLFRSSHDPSPRVAQSTLAILKALAPDVRRTVAAHLNAVLADLVPSMVLSLLHMLLNVFKGGREWRVRQAAASATAEAISGAGLAELGPWLERLWTMAFRVADDVKESVRVTGLTLLRTLINLSVRLCDPHHSAPEAVSSALSLLIPFLLSKGLVAETKEARAATLLALQKLAKAAGALIAPHVPDLTGVLLESLSAHESREINYAMQHVASLGIDAAQLEAARVAASAASPASETLDLCVRHVTAPAVPTLVARLASLIQSGVGLPTRAATSRFILSLVRTHRDLCQGQLGRLLRPLLGALRERSAAVRRGFASAAAVVASVQGAGAVRECAEWLTNKWLGDQVDEAELLAAPVLLLELCRADPQHCRSHASLLALCLLAMQDSAEEAKKSGGEAWSDLGGWSADEAVQNEVLATLRVALNAGSWTLRRHAALAMHSLAKERRVSARAAEDLMGVCIGAMAGKAWNGKDSVYEAVSALSLLAAPSSSISGASLEDSAPHAALAAALWKEATRGEKKMRTAALTALNEVLKHRTPRNAALYGDMRTAMAANLCTLPEHTEERAEALKWRESATVALSAAFSAVTASAEEAAAHVELLAKIRQSNAWQVGAVALRGMVSTVERGAPLSPPLVAAAAEAAVAGLGDTKYSAVRNAASALIAAINARDSTALTPLAKQISAAITAQK